MGTRGETRANVAAILWDLDGTLVASEHLHEAVEREVLATRGVTLTPEAARDLSGVSTREAFAGLLGAVGRGDELEAALADKRARVAEAIVARAVPVRGAEDVMRDIPMRTHRFALVTSSERDIAVGLLERFGWSWRFEVVVAAEDVARSKPDPEPYRLACERLGVEPARALVVEDAPLGVRAGKAAGCRVAAIPGSFRAAELGEADFVLSNLGAVVSLARVLG